MEANARRARVTLTIADIVRERNDQLAEAAEGISLLRDSGMLRLAAGRRQAPDGLPGGAQLAAAESAVDYKGARRIV
ncbi:hypothetical protein [Paenibacillus humicola]|uniref:hypothetical protein n=1 Tax=Paenibacillus humicola TaxID=3110540 RepID=UPI00237A33C2|nr:hypothetical protein [Paenibacillus humicola]